MNRMNRIVANGVQWMNKMVRKKTAEERRNGKTFELDEFNCEWDFEIDFQFRFRNQLHALVRHSDGFILCLCRMASNCNPLNSTCANTNAEFVPGGHSFGCGFTLIRNYNLSVVTINDVAWLKSISYLWPELFALRPNEFMRWIDVLIDLSSVPMVCNYSAILCFITANIHKITECKMCDVNVIGFTMRSICMPNRPIN